jgi:membrane protease YdiL (CAAX protease family)
VAADHADRRRRRRRKTAPGPAPSRTWSARYALGAWLATLLLDFAIAILLPRGDLRVGLGVLIIDLAMLAALVPLYRSRPFTRRDLGLRPTKGPAAVGWGLLAVIAYFGIAIVWSAAVIGHPTGPVPQLHEGGAATILTGLAIAVCAPVVEEIFFRGLLYRALRNRLNWLVAALIVGVLFGAVHASTYPLDTLPIKAAFGVIACLLYERTGSLYPCIALHMFVDGAGFESVVDHGNIGIALLGALGLSVFVVGHHRFRRPRQPEIDAFLWRPGPATPEPQRASEAQARPAAPVTSSNSSSAI